MYVKPYIGITGFTTIEQVKHTVQLWDSLKCESHQLMMGFLIGYKELAGLPHESFKYCKLNGEFEQMLKISRHPNIFRVVHFNTHNTDDFADDLINYFLENEKFCPDGFQLNIAKPHPKEIRKLIGSYEIKIILQVNKSLYTELNSLQGYPDVHYYLIDPSGGIGKNIDPNWLDQIISDLPIPTNQIGIAGGLCPENIAEFAHNHPICSFDAESKLRTNNELDLVKVEAYLKNFVTTIKKINEVLNLKLENKDTNSLFIPTEKPLRIFKCWYHAPLLRFPCFSSKSCTYCGRPLIWINPTRLWCGVCSTEYESTHNIYEDEGFQFTEFRYFNRVKRKYSTFFG